MRCLVSSSGEVFEHVGDSAIRRFPVILEGNRCEDDAAPVIPHRTLHLVLMPFLKDSSTASDDDE